MHRPSPIPLLFVTAINCASPDATTSPTFLPPPAVAHPPAAPQPRVATRLKLFLTPSDAQHVGMRNWITIEATDNQGRTTNTDQSTATSSDPSVAEIIDAQVFKLIDIRGDTTAQRWPVLRLKSPGATTVRVTLGNLTDSVVVRVAPAPPTSTALVVDSFTVVEYPVACAWACPYLAYAPLLKLREPTGKSSVTVIGVEFVVSTQKIGMCSGIFPVTSGTSAHVNPIFPYLWSNDLIVVSVDGTPLPDGPTTARVILRDAKGNIGQITAVGSIQRMVQNPDLPRPIDNASYWTC